VKPEKRHPIKQMFRSPVLRDAATFFLSNNLSNIKDTFTRFRFCDDRTNTDLAHKKKYNVWKQKHKERKQQANQVGKFETAKRGRNF